MISLILDLALNVRASPSCLPFRVIFLAVERLVASQTSDNWELQNALQSRFPADFGSDIVFEQDGGFLAYQRKPSQRINFSINGI